MIKSVDKITVERVFNVGNYQTIRFGMEVTPTPLNNVNQIDVTDIYNRCLCAVETAFNSIMKGRQQQQNQQQY